MSLMAGKCRRDGLQEQDRLIDIYQAMITNSPRTASEIISLSVAYTVFRSPYTYNTGLNVRIRDLLQYL
jgi:hypothetical protein